MAPQKLPTPLVWLMLALVILSLAFYRNAPKRLIWRETSAKVVFTQLTKKRDNSFGVAVVISYKIKGVVYRMRKFISSPLKAKSRTYARLILTKIREGEPVDIIYNQENPKEWKLKAKLRWDH